MTQYTDIINSVNVIIDRNYEYYGEINNQGQKEGFGIKKWRDQSTFKGYFLKNMQ